MRPGTGGTVRILLHDYSGHPFQVQLSRALAREGHQVLHLFSSRFQTPKGNLVRQEDDPEGFDVQGLTLSEPFQKDSFLKRRAQEIEFGQLVGERMKAFRPDIVISSNAPLDTQRKIMQAARRLGAKFVFWLQDIYSEAMLRILPKKLPVIGWPVARYYSSLEYRMLRGSDFVISICEDFLPFLTRHGVDKDRGVTVIENWAPLDEIVPVERENVWAQEHMPAPGLCVVYSGTLGYKHSPELLLETAKALGDAGHVYVFSDGTAARALAQQGCDHDVRNMSLAPWVPFDKLSQMLSGADVFIAMIEADAGVFSVPSKVLTYLCIGRPILAAIPEGNLARKIIEREGAGLVSVPGDVNGFLNNLKRLAGDPEMRAEMGRNGRAYAQANFDIRKICARFVEVLDVVQPKIAT